jgi:hypothetical protein
MINYYLSDNLMGHYLHLFPAKDDLSAVRECKKRKLKYVYKKKSNGLILVWGLGQLYPLCVKTPHVYMKSNLWEIIFGLFDE